MKVLRPKLWEETESTANNYVLYTRPNWWFLRSPPWRPQWFDRHTELHVLGSKLGFLQEMGNNDEESSDGESCDGESCDESEGKFKEGF